MKKGCEGENSLFKVNFHFSSSFNNFVRFDPLCSLMEEEERIYWEERRRYEEEMEYFEWCRRFGRDPRPLGPPGPRFGPPGPGLMMPPVSSFVVF